MKPIFKWIIGIVVFILVSLTGAIWYFSNKWKPLLDTKIRQLVVQATDSLYTIHYDDIHVNLALGNLTIENFRLIPDTGVYRKLEGLKKAPDNRFEIAINKLKIKSFGIRKVLMDKELFLHDITVDTPTVHVINEFHSYNDTISRGPEKPLYEKIKENLKKIQVEAIQLNDVDFKYTQVQKGVHQDFEIKKVKVRIDDVLIDSTSAQDKQRFYHTKMVDIEVPGFTYKTPDGFYKIDFDQLKINSKERNVLLTKVAYQPTLNKAAYYKKKGKGGSYIVFKMDTLQLMDFNFGQLSRDKKVYAQKAVLKNGQLSVYSDKHYKSPATRQIGNAPHMKLMKMSTRLGIDTLVLDNIGISYSEMSDQYSQIGTITFDHTYGTILNVTNDSTKLQKQKLMRANLSTNFMNSGKLLTNFVFDMTSKVGAYTYKGSLGQMDLRLVNKMIRPLLNVEVKSGNLRQIVFDIWANDYRSKGTFKMDYNDLKVNILSETGDDGRREKKGFLSFMVNQVLFNPGNPDLYGKYTVGHINKHRDPTHPFFKALWQSLLMGIKQCVGLGPEREAKLMNTADRVEKVVNGVEKAKKLISGIFKKHKTAEELLKEEKEEEAKEAAKMEEKRKRDREKAEKELEKESPGN
ncbi:hypothetical protein K7A41_15510 [Sphingobacterium sp. InxBP1]|uniref:hypothetical protein n=1 Tax=Sphingobacterium sp. InxBP1 TaxID=2870328 RepID=UPI0022446358|nr:hypothetical protein [Sphingobacterium sp. InxBP1]MCW8312639.1 hypothetical protein [Sphingobacterium sp. InxBP1]